MTFLEDRTEDLLSIAQLSVKSDQPYGLKGQLCDVYLPNAPASGELLPMIIGIHGGGWCKGTKDWLIPASKDLSIGGFIVIAINYMLTQPDSTYPNQREEVRQAVLWARSHAPRMNGDPDKIGLFGTSAGGTLAGWGCEDASLNPDLWPGVVAGAGWSPCTDFPTLMDTPQEDPRYAEFAEGVDAVFGPGTWTRDDARLQVCSLTAAPSSLPYQLSGSSDEFMPAQQFDVFEDHYTSIGAEHEVRIYDGTGHGTKVQNELDDVGVRAVDRTIYWFKLWLS